MAVLIARYRGFTDTLLPSHYLNEQIKKLLEGNQIVFLSDGVKATPLKTYLSKQTIRVTLREFEGGQTMDIVGSFTGGQSEPIVLNQNARRQHQKELFLLLSLILHRLKIKCPEDIKFMILNYVTQDTIVNGRFNLMDFIVEA